MSTRAVFRAMASPVELEITGGGTGLDTTGRALIEHLEQRWSRFLPTSDITRLNLAGGRPIEVHPDTIGLVEAMVEAWMATQGMFDPTLLSTMLRIGYAASTVDPSRLTTLPDGCGNAGDLLGVEIDHDAHTIRLPTGTALDPGAIGKGLAADLTVARLLARGARGALVNIGGDISAAGDPGDGDAWQVGVNSPYSDREIARVALAEGGVATSGITRRRLVDSYGVAHHHLLDPSTGRAPSHSLVQATVVSGTAAWAEALATQVMIGGPTALRTVDGAALCVDVSGRVTTNDSWADYAMTSEGAER